MTPTSINQKKIKKITLFRGVVLPGLIIFFSITIFLGILSSTETAFFKNASDTEVIETTNLLNKRLQIALLANESVKGFFEGSQNVTAEEFEVFTKNLADRIRPLGMNIMLEWIDEKNVIRYIHPMDNKTVGALNFDMSSYPNRMGPISEAIEKKGSIIAEPIMLIEGYPGLVIYTPIFKGNTYAGLAGCVIRTSELFAFDVNSQYEKNEHIQTNKFILPFENDVIYTTEGGIVSEAKGNIESATSSKEYLIAKDDITRKINFVDKQWEFHASADYVKDINQRMLPYTLLGYLFALVIMYLFFIVYRRNEALFTEEARTQALFASIQEGLVATDKNGTITFVNEDAEKISGYTAEEMLGKPYTKIWRLVDEKGTALQEKNRPFYRALINSTNTEIETVSKLFLLKKDGTRMAVTSNISPIMTDKKNVAGVLITFRDNTKESEIDRMKTEFLSLASHQLLTPITAIKLISEMFMTGFYGAFGSAEQKENITNIHILAERMSGLIKSLLNISRIESGRIIVNPKPTNLKDLITELYAELKNKIETKKQTLIIKVDENLKEINIDPQLIREVYKNFLTNAVKYTPEGGMISVEVTIQDQNVLSKISDNGYGIPAAEQSKMFEKFYRGQNIVKIEDDGNGLGLYLVKQILDVSEGKVWFESEENKGTTFWFTLPLAGNKLKAGEVILG
jgi:PAS domain S-box-containing protein